ncbi:uncharacterized protein LOC125462462 isoform X2 [Stegostoma tigrinum]|uniref:uncharacterized protein LOC125462462 isoform X2 n=1 Tax=Stegostoma tigrinum TaxID=3053191 RepID=UPI00202AE2F7|nr:uncharacterized protein LOC125462462 isoform X2 [Stegostoma tigrinum]
MLPAQQARRLSSLLVEAIKECTEEERKLEDELKSYRKLLKPWNPRTEEKPAKNGASTSKTEHGPHFEELQELELLNRTLAKALRIRQTYQNNMFGMKQIQPRASEDSTVPNDAGYGIVKQSQASDNGDKPLEEILPRTRWSNSKKKVTGANVNNICGKVTAPVCKERYVSSYLAVGTAGKRVTTHAGSSRKPGSCALKLPYKTKQEAKRKSMSSAMGKLARGSLHAPSLVKTAAIQQTKRSASVDKVGNRAQQSRHWSLTTIPRTIVSGNVLIPEDTDMIQRKVTPRSIQISAYTDTAPTMTSPVMRQQGANCINEAVSLRASEGNMLQNESSSTEKLKLFTLQESGSTLKLPLAWRKQQCRNTCLWGQVSTRQTDEIQKASFMQRIQSTFHSQLPPVSYAQIEEQLDNVRELYKCIDQYIRTDPLLNSSGPLSCQHEHESLQILERCQETVSSLIHQIEQLMAGYGRRAASHSIFLHAFRAIYLPPFSCGVLSAL